MMPGSIAIRPGAVLKLARNSHSGQFPAFSARRIAPSAIVSAFQVPVDGWLTKLRDPVVIYDPDQMLGLRAPWDIPVEDFGFGFAMVTLTILLWRRHLDRRAAAPAAHHAEETHP